MPRLTSGLRKLGSPLRLVARPLSMPCGPGLAATLLPTIGWLSKWISGTPSTQSAVRWCYGKCGSISLPWLARLPGATGPLAPYATLTELQLRGSARRPLRPAAFCSCAAACCCGSETGAFGLLRVFYLDDGVLAGPVEAVAKALGALQQASARLGLALNLDKSEAIAVGRTSPAALTAHLPASLLTAADGSSRVLRNFEFLGAAIGRPAFLEAHAAGCVETADKLFWTDFT